MKKLLFLMAVTLFAAVAAPVSYASPDPPPGVIMTAYDEVFAFVDYTVALTPSDRWSSVSCMTCMQSDLVVVSCHFTIERPVVPEVTILRICESQICDYTIISQLLFPVYKIGTTQNNNGKVRMPNPVSRNGSLNVA